MKTSLHSFKFTALLAAAAFAASFAAADDGRRGDPASGTLPSYAQVTAVLKSVVTGGGNAGFGLNMWATIVDRDGVVRVVTFSGANRGDQWPGSRVISAQKANTANAFSLPGLALSTANLYSATQPGGTLFGLQHSNPVDTEAAYSDDSKKYGQPNDPLVGRKVGGVNVFGGGLALYNSAGVLLGALGVSGDTSCADHIIAWKIRHALNLDNVPAGVNPVPSVPGKTDDNIVHDIVTNPYGISSSPSGWGHPITSVAEKAVATGLSTVYPTGPNP